MYKTGLKSGQFGYLRNVGKLEDSFVCINIPKHNNKDDEKQFQDKNDREMKVEYIRYDITSSTPQQLPETGSVSPDDFIPVHGSHIGDLNDQAMVFVQLLSWKICREDYLSKKLELIADIDNEYIFLSTEDEAYHTQAYYSVSDAKTDVDLCVSDNETETQIFSENGYSKDKHLCNTLKGSIFIANDVKNNSEPVCIKKMKILNNLEINSDLVKRALLQPHSQYFDFFQTARHFYFVLQMDFGANLRQFVTQSQQYIRSGELQMKQYRKKIKEILWELILCAKDLHGREVRGLDMCVENIFLRNSDFLQNADGTVMIHPEMDCRLVDFGLKGLCEMEEEKGNDAGNMELEFEASEAADIYHFGNVCYFSFVFEALPSDAEMIRNLKMYLRMKNLMKLLVPKSLLLLQDLLNASPEFRLKTVSEVMRHRYFRRFYNFKLQ